MKIKDKRNFLSGMIALVITIGCVAGYMYEHETRYIISGLLTVIWCIVSIWLSFKQKGTAEQMEDLLDERDKLIVLKSNSATLKIMNYILSACCFVGLMIYVIFDNVIALSIGITTLAVLLIMFMVVLAANGYYEKKI